MKSIDLKQNIELVATIIIVFIVMGTYYFYLYREYKKTKKTFEMKRYTSTCPDYWTLTDNSNPNDTNPVIMCSNPKKIGRCNYTEPKDFSSDLYKDDIAKCKWSKYCNAPWEGVDNLCADLTINQLNK